MTSVVVGWSRWSQGWEKKELALFGYYRGEPMDPLSQLPSEVTAPAVTGQCPLPPALLQFGESAWYSGAGVAESAAS